MLTVDTAQSSVCEHFGPRQPEKCTKEQLSYTWKIASVYFAILFELTDTHVMQILFRWLRSINYRSAAF